MEMISVFLKELEQESVTTRKMLERVPTDKFDWQPHSKSMTIQQLTTHIAELPTWISLVLNTDELDFASSPYNPQDIKDTPALLEFFEKSLTEGKNALEAANEKQLDDIWVLRNGEMILSKTSKSEFIRITFSQVVHHRAQLGVYLRLLDIPIPGSYGPSADEQKF
ncbi:DinB family protein [Dyadobacter sp. CY345]|uniref:DinB family protein n=1 Tax=Dyadobacter sp. CY345 TaxID=2909335 RepID=UPI001F40F52D|nr:DinB family protein [Dyadobacter sp. CY345]MCF2447462.1 DinB family protein [Dyadobacter sp. CY345]